MSATPCPGRSGCRCPWCFGLAEYMSALTGSDYDLPVTFQPWRAEPEPVEAPVQFRPRVVRQPWQPRPARRAA